MCITTRRSEVLTVYRSGLRGAEPLGSGETATPLGAGQLIERTSLPQKRHDFVQAPKGIGVIGVGLKHSSPHRHLEGKVRGLPRVVRRLLQRWKSVVIEPKG